MPGIIPARRGLTPHIHTERAMTAARAGREALPEDPEEIRNFFLGRARERDRARDEGDKPRETGKDATAPKKPRDDTEPGRAPAKPNKGPWTTPKSRSKPYTIRYLTAEEARALKRKT